MKCCGKPICNDCRPVFTANINWEAGCPNCRSTMDIMYLNVDYFTFDVVTVRINGHCETIQISERTRRRFNRSLPINFEGRTLEALHAALMPITTATIAPFIEQEIKDNPRIARLMREKTTDGTYRFVLFSFRAE